MHLVRVAVPVPALDSLTYSLPDSLETPVVGARVLVPLGNRVLTGCVVGDAEAADKPTSTIKPIIEILDAEPFLPADVVRLATWVADYYACGIGSALAAAMPPMAVAGSAGGRPQLGLEPEVGAGIVVCFLLIIFVNSCHCFNSGGLL